MPIEVSLLEPAIYLSRWIGNVTPTDVLESLKTGGRMSAAQGDKRAILIVDFGEVTRFPISLQLLQGSVAKGEKRVMKGVLLLNAPYAVRLVGENLRKIYRRKIVNLEFVNSMEAAMKRAREMLDKASEEGASHNAN
jgi:hypothetical protein